MRTKRSAKNWRNRKRNTFFSLIELLVVVAIISILISILLPALKKARNMAKRTDCQNRLRQMSLAMNSYASDYDGSFPPVNTGNWISGQTCFEAIDAYVFGKTPPVAVGDAFYHCPAETRRNTQMSYAVNSKMNSGNVPGGIWSYGGGMINPTDVFGEPRLKISQIPDFSGTFQITCAAQSGTYSYTMLSGNYVRRPLVWNGSDNVLSLGLIHQRASNWVFCDGHVEWMTWQNSVGPNGSGVNPKGIWSPEAGD